MTVPLLLSLSLSLSLSLHFAPLFSLLDYFSHTNRRRMFNWRRGSKRKYVRTVANRATTNTDRRVFDAMNVYRRECVGVTGK
jgi:hypothetical protein